ncbi:MAG: virulence factor [Thiolinea sp.]
MPQKIVVFWRDIPSQIIIQQGRAKGKQVLSQRFQEAIDKAAMRAGMSDPDSYVEQWHRETSEHERVDDVQAAAEAVAGDYEARYSDTLLEAMVRNKGLTVEA